MPRALAMFAALALVLPLLAQAPPASKKVAATVNGRPITEAAVVRALKPVAPENRAKAEKAVLDVVASG